MEYPFSWNVIHWFKSAVVIVGIIWWSWSLCITFPDLTQLVEVSVAVGNNSKIRSCHGVEDGEARVKSTLIFDILSDQFFIEVQWPVIRVASN